MTDIIFDLIKQEEKRQKEVVDLIPSENHTSPEVRKVLASVLVHKYAEGYPKKRYYQGNANVDEVESICKQRALDTFQLDKEEWGVNVQAYSGAPANLAVYNAVLQPGDTIMAMYLPDGGHLSHGWRYKDFSTLVGKIWKAEFYHVDPKTQLFNYDEIAKQAKKVKPKMLISGGTAYAREIDHKRMGEIAESIGAFYLADVSHEAGLIAGGVNGSPFPYADAVMMTTHKTLRGPRGALIFGRKNSIRTNKKGVDIASAVDRSIFPGMQGGPHMHTIGAIAVALEEAQRPAFKTYAKQIIKNAQAMATYFSDHGLTVVSGGTDKHLILINARDTGIEAWVAAWALEYAGIILNRNTVPNDQGSPYYPSGIRLGTPIMTTRGMKVKEAKQIAKWIVEGMNYSKKWQIPADKDERKIFLKNLRKELAKDEKLKAMKKDVLALTAQFPVFTW